MNTITGYSNKSTVEEVVNDIKNQLLNFDIKMVLFFASSIYNPETISYEMKKAFGNAQIFGCTTAGEIVSGKMLKNSIVAMGFTKEIVDDVKIEVVENVKQENNVPDAFNAFEKYYGCSMRELNVDDYVGIILVDGLSGAEEKVMEKIGDLTDVLFIGGAAGDDLKFKSTYVYANGKSYSNAAVLALLKPTNGFEIIKTQSFCQLDKKMIVTKANEDAREVIEFNNQPAAKVYAEAVGKSVANASNNFMHNPVGLMVGDEPYVRSPQQFKDDSLIFYCNIKEGMEVSLLESTDIVRDTKNAVYNKLKEVGNVSGIVNFHCILRTLELEQNGYTEEYGRIFSEVPTIGFSTYGEEYIGHINQTSTMLLFK